MQSFMLLIEDFMLLIRDYTLPINELIIGLSIFILLFLTFYGRNKSSKLYFNPSVTKESVTKENVIESIYKETMTLFKIVETKEYIVDNREDDKIIFYYNKDKVKFDG